MFTERRATVESEAYCGRHCWAFGRVAYRISTTEPAFHRVSRTYEFRSQPDRDELGVGLPVTMIYVGGRAPWVELPSGATLVTDEHPFWEAIVIAWIPATWRTARRNKSWTMISVADVEPRIMLLIPAAGFVGWFVQALFPSPAGSTIGLLALVVATPMVIMAISLVRSLGRGGGRHKRRRSRR